MTKVWTPQERVPLDHLNEIEEKAEKYDALMAGKRPATGAKPDDKDKDKE